MKSLLIGLLTAMTLSGPAWGYDKDLAASYDKYYSTFKEKELAKALKLVPVDKFMKAIKAGEKLTILDIRARAETSVFGFTYKNTLNIPIHELFKEENLARIPTGHKVIVACQGGLRSTGINWALRSLGFRNTYSLKGGLDALATYLTPKTAF